MDSKPATLRQPFPVPRKAWQGMLALFVLGGAVWLTTLAVAGDREIWRAPIFYLFAIPASLAIGVVVGTIAAWRCGGPPWRWPLSFFAGQGLVELALWQTRGGGHAWPAALAALVLLALPCWFATSFVTRVRERVR